VVVVKADDEDVWCVPRALGWHVRVPRHAVGPLPHPCLCVCVRALVCGMGGLGIFAYLNYDTPRERQYVLSTLIVGLQRLEYRGYDSAGAQTHRERERDSWRFSRRAFSLAFLPRRA
jgi:hypothetical protein